MSGSARISCGSSLAADTPEDEHVAHVVDDVELSAAEVEQATLKSMMKTAGFGHVDVHNLTGGVVALHVGVRC